MNENIRIKLSAGLIFVAVVHAVLLGVVFALLHVKPQVATQSRLATSGLSDGSRSGEYHSEAGPTAKC